MQNSSKILPIAKKIGLTGIDKVPNVVFRTLRADEDEWSVKAKGIFAKKVASTKPVKDHITHNGEDSPWISTTNLLSVAQRWAMLNCCNIAVIDYSKLQGCELVDARDGLPELGALANNFAKSSQEICVYQHIPAEAVITVIPYYRLVAMCTMCTVSDSRLATASLELALKGLESFANQPNNWLENLDAIVERSQKLWAINRCRGDKLKVGF